MTVALTSLSILTDQGQLLPSIPSGGLGTGARVTSLGGSTSQPPVRLQCIGPAVGRKENLAVNGPVYVHTESWGRVPGSLNESALG